MWESWEARGPWTAPCWGSHAWQNTTGLGLAPGLELCLQSNLFPARCPCSTGQAGSAGLLPSNSRFARGGGAWRGLQEEKGVKCLQRCPQCQQQRRGRGGQRLQPCAAGSLYLRRVPCCHFSSEQQQGSRSTAEHSPSPRGRAGTVRLAEAGGGSGRVGWGQAWGQGQELCGRRRAGMAAARCCSGLQAELSPPPCPVPPALWGLLCWPHAMAWVPLGWQAQGASHGPLCPTTTTPTRCHAHTVPKPLALVQCSQCLQPHPSTPPGDATSLHLP